MQYSLVLRISSKINTSWKFCFEDVSLEHSYLHHNVHISLAFEKLCLPNIWNIQSNWNMTVTHIFLLSLSLISVLQSGKEPLCFFCPLFLCFLLWHPGISPFLFVPSFSQKWCKNCIEKILTCHHKRRHTTRNWCKLLMLTGC